MVVLLPRVLKDGVEDLGGGNQVRRNGLLEEVCVNGDENVIYVQVLVLHSMCCASFA